jgi:hypothetical protein
MRQMLAEGRPVVDICIEMSGVSERLCVSEKGTLLPENESRGAVGCESGAILDAYIAAVALSKALEFRAAASRGGKCAPRYKISNLRCEC